MADVRANWQKQSYKRWSADVGPLTIEVRLVGLSGQKRWIVGEVFGRHHHGGPGRELFEAVEDAQEAAELVAVRMLEPLQYAIRKWTYRPPAAKTRRRHSKDGVIRCPICSPLRCVRAK